jgi:hypothetical protein
LDDAIAKVYGLSHKHQRTEDMMHCRGDSWASQSCIWIQ